MQIHATCVARESRGVLLLGPSGAGKSDLALRLIGRGFVLVADDRVDLLDGLASPPEALAGLLEVRGVGLVRMSHQAPVRVVLAVELGGPVDRLPAARVHDASGARLLALEPFAASAADKVLLALADVAGGR